MTTAAIPNALLASGSSGAWGTSATWDLSSWLDQSSQLRRLGFDTSVIAVRRQAVAPGMTVTVPRAAR